MSRALRAAVAPRYTNRVEVYVELDSGENWSDAWTTPVSFGMCFSRARNWTLRDMRAQKIKGRSKIAKMEISVERTGKVWQETE